MITKSKQTISCLFHYTIFQENITKEILQNNTIFEQKKSISPVDKKKRKEKYKPIGKF